MKKVLLIVVVALVAFLLFEWATFPDVSKLSHENPMTTSFIELRKEKLREAGQSDRIEQTWVPYEKISPFLRRAVLVSEDDAFYQHNGVNVDELKEALRRDWKRKRFAYGGSTVTQQLAKNLYLSPSRNPIRKIKEFLIARELEKNLTKKRILEVYLNVVEFGERVYGAEAAARHYFSQPVASISPSQAALLAGCLPNPVVMNPGAPDKRLRRRQRIILSRMRRWGYLIEREVLSEKKPQPEPIVAPAQPPAASPQTDSGEAASTDTTSATTTETSAPPPSESAPSQPSSTSEQTATIAPTTTAP